MRAFVVDVEEKPGNNVVDVTVRVSLREWDAFKLTAPGGVWGRQRGRVMTLGYEGEQREGSRVDGGGEDRRGAGEQPRSARYPDG
jgi:hypothetical protein